MLLDEDPTYPGAFRRWCQFNELQTTCLRI